MKHFLAIAIFVTLSAFTANAQQECDTAALTDLYNKFLKDHKGTPEQKKIADQTGKNYVSKYGACESEAERKITKYVSDWLADYEAEMVESACVTAVEKAPAQAFELCKPYVARDPENLRAHLLLSAAGVKQVSDKRTHEQTLKAARKSLELMRANKQVKVWVFGGTKDETVAALEFYVASLTIDTTPADTASAMLKLARSETSYSRDPNTYFLLGRTLYTTEVKKQLDEYKQKCAGAEATPDCDAAFKTLEVTIDRVIDAYARAVALTYGRSEHARVSKDSMDALVDLYKKRNNDSDAGLKELIAGVLSKPIP